jgi:hypothetical protein
MSPRNTLNTRKVICNLKRSRNSRVSRSKVLNSTSALFGVPALAGFIGFAPTDPPPTPPRRGAGVRPHCVSSLGGARGGFMVSTERIESEAACLRCESGSLPVFLENQDLSQKQQHRLVNRGIEETAKYADYAEASHWESFLACLAYFAVENREPQRSMNPPTPDASGEGSERVLAMLVPFPWEGVGVGSGSHCMRKNESGLSMDLVAATVKRRQILLGVNCRHVTATDTVHGHHPAGVLGADDFLLEPLEKAQAGQLEGRRITVSSGVNTACQWKCSS